MKTISLLTLLFIAAFSLKAQTVQLENLHQFDKLVVNGVVKSIELTHQYHKKPMVTVIGVSKDDIESDISAGVLYLEVTGEISEIIVANTQLKRIETPDSATEIIGAEVVGADGNYLVMNLNNQRGLFAHNTNIDVNLPDIDFDHDFEFPDIDIDIPEIDFDLNHHIDADWNWNDHKEEFQMMSDKVRDEVEKVMKEVKSELKKIEDR